MRKKIRINKMIDNRDPISIEIMGLTGFDRATLDAEQNSIHME